MLIVRTFVCVCERAEALTLSICSVSLGLQGVFVCVFACIGRTTVQVAGGGDDDA